MFLGLYPHVSGHRSLNNMIKEWESNLFRSLKEDGYHVACLAPRGDTYAPTVTELSMDEYGFIETPDIMPGFAKGGEKPQARAAPEKKEDIWSRLFYKGLRDPEAILDYDEAAVRSALLFLEHPPEGPWVLYLPLIFPHVPFQVEEPYFSLYDRKSLPPLASLTAKVRVALLSRKTGLTYHLAHRPDTNQDSWRPCGLDTAFTVPRLKYGPKSKRRISA
jgi:hypothetical protein